MADLPCARRTVSQWGTGAFLFVWALWGSILLVPTALSLMAIAVPFAPLILLNEESSSYAAGTEFQAFTPGDKEIEVE